MGVTYKLKKEIVDYIIEQKRTNTDLSCRRLADAIKERFQVEVSKSSVNTIIKQALLSSPVGRRSGSGKPTKGFKIPPEKKTGLFVDDLKDVDKAPASELPADVEKKPIEPTPSFPEGKDDKFLSPAAAPTSEGLETKTPQITPESPVLPPSPEVKAKETEVPQEDILKPPPEEITPEKKEEPPPLRGKPFKAEPEIPQEETKLKPADFGPEEKKDTMPPIAAEEKIPPQTAPPSQAMDETKRPDKAAPTTPPAKPYIDDKIWTPDKEHLAETQVSKIEVSGEKSDLLDGMGCFFLKGAEWDLSHASVLGGLINKHSHAYLPLDINAVSEVLLYLEAFGINKLEDIKHYEKSGLFELNGIKQKINYETLLKVVEGVSNLRSLSVAMSNEYSQLFTEINYIKISSVDKTEICMDAQFKSAWLENNAPSVFTVPINKSLSYLSASVISNTQPAILFSCPGYTGFSKQFYDLVSIFENLPDKKIERIGIFDIYKEEIAKFTIVPSKKRSFIIGVWPWQEECKKFIEEDVRLVKSFYQKALESEIYYSELKAKLAQPVIGQTVDVRVALLRESGLGWPFMAIVTNIPAGMAMEDIISLYLLRWPNLKEGYSDFVSKTEKASYGSLTVVPPPDKIALLKGDGQYNLLGGGALDFWTNIQFLLSGLNNYCQRHFFPPHYESLNFSSIKERFYGLSGYMAKDRGILSVNLSLPEGYSYRKDLEYALRRFNESDIKDLSQTRLMMRIQP